MTGATGTIRPSVKIRQRWIGSHLSPSSRPTLLVPLRSSTRWINGEWVGLDDGPVLVDFDSPARSVDSTLVGLFDGTRSQLEDDSVLPTVPRDPAQRLIDANWTQVEDELLRSLDEKYPQMRTPLTRHARRLSPSALRTAKSASSSNFALDRSTLRQKSHPRPHLLRHARKSRRANVLLVRRGVIIQL